MGGYRGFNEIELKRPQRSMFDMSHEKRLSTRMGRLTPVFVAETLPNDTFSVSTEVLIKLAPLIAPVLHRMNLYVHFFFVPMRLLVEDWEDFITGGRLGEAVDSPPTPPRKSIRQILNRNADYLDVGSLADYLGIPPVPDSAAADWTDNLQHLNIAPFLCYQKIWNDYYRDRNFEPDMEDVITFPAGPGTYAGSPVADAYLLSVKSRAWQHDYFTSAQTSAQRGSEVLMPLEGSGTVTYKPQSEVYTEAGGFPADLGQLLGTGRALDLEQNKLMINKPAAGFSANLGVAGRIENIDSVEVDASSVSINDLRTAVALQTWLERNQLAGSRMNETIMAHYARKTSDSRLQRAEYLGGGKAVVKIDEVMTTAYSEDADTNLVPPGNMAGRGSAYSQTNRFSYNCEEWGFVMGILSVMPTSAYMQGVPRMFTARQTFLAYPWPSFAHLGEQVIYNHELYMSPASMDPTQVPTEGDGYTGFGYQSRYSDWKQIPSSSHGDFRTSLDFWHLTRKFAAEPVLDGSFVTFEDELQDRIFNVSGGDTLWLYVYNQTKVVRSLPYYGTPRL